MKISEVQILPVKPNNGLVGFASAVLDDKLYVSGIGIHKKLNGSGYRITYPETQVGRARMGVFHPITKELGKNIAAAINNQCMEVFNDG